MARAISTCFISMTCVTFLGCENSVRANMDISQDQNQQLPTSQTPMVESLQFEIVQGLDLSVQLVAYDPVTGPENLRFIITEHPLNGALLDFDETSGSLTFRSESLGSDQFKFCVSDGSQTSLDGTIEVMVLEPSIENVAPQVNDVFVGDSVTAGETVTVQLQANDADQGPESLSFEFENGPTLGSLGSLNSVARTVQYTATAGVEGDDSFQYRVYDGEAYSDYALVELTVVPVDVVNHPPVVQSFTVTMVQNQSRNIDLRAQDSDGDSLRYDIVSESSHGTVTNSNPSSERVVYTPDTDYVGGDQFSYRVWDGQEFSTVATVSITVNEPVDPGAGIVADHNSVEVFESIPDSAIQDAKAMFKLTYGHTSHGSQIVSGMTWMEGEMASPFDFDYSSSGCNDDVFLCDRYPGGDLGTPPSTTWETSTRDLLEGYSFERNVVMWSWCGQVSGASEEGIQVYLDTMEGLIADYPDVLFIFMTGHLDGTGDDGNLRARNNQIRQHVRENGRILFDFADIESYDPNGIFHPNETDACTWCVDWCTDHPEDCVSLPSSCAHSHPYNCTRKGKAFWWMMSRLAGWDGQ